MKATLILVLVAVSLACQPGTHTVAGSDRKSAARGLTSQYAGSALARWKVSGQAGGTDCAVLFVQTAIPMEDSLVEALHYGAGAYDIYRGGVQQFSRDRAFRGVIYRDRAGRVWTFGNAGPHETISACP